jgi:hypothetical protein
MAAALLAAVLKLAPELETEFGDVVTLIRDQATNQVLGVHLLDGEVLQVRVEQCYQQLCRRTCNLIFDRNVDSVETLALPVSRQDKDLAVRVVCEKYLPQDWHSQFEDQVQDSLLTLRGLLVFEVLFHCLTRRWSVHYGSRRSQGQAEQQAGSSSRLMAVPYRAKDVPAPRAEFGHSDVAIVFTLLSYCYEGLRVKDFEQCLDKLMQRDDSEHQYARWLKALAPSSPEPPSSPIGINLEDAQQRRKLFGIFKRNPATIEFWLAMFVFRLEAKRFAERISASAWDLCKPVEARVQGQASVVGFSGSVDAQLCFPTDTKQRVRGGTSAAVLLDLVNDKGAVQEVDYIGKEGMCCA